MLRDKILFVMKLQKLKKSKIPLTFVCHPSQRNEHIKMWETHPNDYLVFSKMTDLLSLIPLSSTFQDGGWVIFSTLGTFRMWNSLPTCVPPPPPILGQTIDWWIQFNQLYLNTVNGSASWFSDMPCNNYNWWPTNNNLALRFELYTCSYRLL